MPYAVWWPESFARPLRAPKAKLPHVRIGFIHDRLQLELDVESRNPRWNRDHRIQVELGHLGAFLCEPGNPE
jgi:hypothetical protein